MNYINNKPGFWYIHQGWDVSNKDGEEKVWKEKYDEYVERPKSKSFTKTTREKKNTQLMQTKKNALECHSDCPLSLNLFDYLAKWVWHLTGS